MMNDEEKTGSAEARKRGKAEKTISENLGNRRSMINGHQTWLALTEMLSEN
jgi:hypothetical protein